MAQKQPFERILSLLDRKKILAKLLSEKSELYIKHLDGHLSLMKVRNINADGCIFGDWMTDKMNSPLKSLVAFFYVSKERYFIKTDMQASGNSWALMPTTQFYRLNRRTHYRVEIPPSVVMTFYIQSLRDTEVGKAVRVLDFSAGGRKNFPAQHQENWPRHSDSWRASVGL
jgi:hypothetical protein